MAALRRVFGNQAGPEAIGILVPPGARTVVLVRPRALPWDLLPIDARDCVAVIRFREFAREEAEAAAEALGRALEEWASGANGRVEIAPAPGAPGHCVRVLVGRYCLLVCPRRPGQAYRPMVWATESDAKQAVDSLRAALCPPPGAEREIYFNSRHFTR
jgi:hypothetical protein